MDDLQIWKKFEDKNSALSNNDVQIGLDVNSFWLWSLATQLAKTVVWQILQESPMSMNHPRPDGFVTTHLFVLEISPQ